MKQEVTPWEVNTDSLNYSKLIDSFGCSPITPETILLFKKALKKAGHPEENVHFFIKRNIFFAHRDMDVLLQNYLDDKPFYLYTGRGPSSESMHLGHSIPFVFCVYLQKVFDLKIVIQITDDEKFLFNKSLELSETKQYAIENIKDIISFGFDPRKTFIFTNCEFIHKLFNNVLRISKKISLNQAKKVFGFNEDSNIGMVQYPARQIAPCFPDSFENFLNKGMGCMIPAAIDQDPFFRLARDKAKSLGNQKPCSIYSQFLPALEGSNKKMSGSIKTSAIYLSDTYSDIKNKINKFAFSGGQETVEEHRALGGNCDLDVCFQYLRYFEENEEKLKEIEESYKTGKMLSGEMKQKCVEKIWEFVEEFQKKRKEVDGEMIKKFMEEDKSKI